MDPWGQEAPEAPAVAAGGSATGAAGPVFVDESGRRSRKLRRIGWVLGAACACYAVLLVGTLLGGNSSAPWLGIPGPAAEEKPGTVSDSPAPEALPSAPDVPGAAYRPAPAASPGAVAPNPTGTAAGRPPAGVAPRPAGPTPRPGVSVSGTPAPPASPVPTGTTGGTDPEPVPEPGPVDPAPVVTETPPAEPTDPVVPPAAEGGAV